MAIVAQERFSEIQKAVAARSALIDSQHQAALCLFNGFSEGCSGLVIDLYGRTLVIFNQSDSPQELDALILLAQHWLLEYFPWVQAVIVKTRRSKEESLRRGVLTYGQQSDQQIIEHGIRYAVELTLNQDASLYLDTRNLRGWLHRSMRGKRVLNTFAYTGSLGAAALAGGASSVVQLDLNDRFLNLARRTYALNNLPIQEQNFKTGDFFRVISSLKQQRQLFDCILLDPPYFSVTNAGRVDLAGEANRLINKVRPLVAHNGCLVAVNNALFVSGEAYLAELKALCSDGYMQVEQMIPVPQDVTGYPETIKDPHYPADPAPFNFPTKIVLLRVTRKDQAAAR